MKHWLLSACLICFGSISQAQTIKQTAQAVTGVPIAPASLTASTITWGDPLTRGVLQANGAIVSKGSVTVTGAGSFSGTVSVGGDINLQSSALVIQPADTVNTYYSGANSQGMSATSGHLLSISQVNDRTKGLTVETTNGNVGIGTTSPATKIHVSSGVFLVDGASGDTLRASVQINGSEYYDSSIGLKNASGGTLGWMMMNGIWGLGNNDLSIYDRGSSATRLIIKDTTGNVGIGTDAPATTLDVNGSAQFGIGATKSTFTAAGMFVPRAATLAQIKAITPAAAELGGYFTCSNCADPYTVCQSTGTTIQGFRLGFAGTAECK